jgi:hypothetical protein
MRKKTQALIVDLDGTLAIFDGVRNGLDFSDVTKDKVNQVVKEVLIMYKKYDRKRKIIVISGRPNNKNVYQQSLFWLKKNKIPFDELFLVDREGLPDAENKKFFYETKIKDKYQIDFVLEDRNSVVKMWREIGLVCFQVAETNY